MKSLLKRAFNNLPSCLKDKINQYREKEGKEKAARLRGLGIIKKQDIDLVLNKFDLMNSDIMIHSSLRNFCYEIEGGSKTVFKSIIEHVDLHKFTLIAPSLPFSTSMSEFLEATKSVDMRTAPNMMGVLSKSISTMDGCLRSLHPTHSVVAVGAHAEDYTSSHHLDRSPFSKNSPYYKIMERKGKILLFGVGLGNLTFPHVIEDLLGDLFPVNVYSRKEYSIDVIGLDGRRHDVITKCHNKKYSSKRNCEFIRQSLIANEAIETYQLGLSEISLLDPRKYALTYFKLLLDGKSLYGEVKTTTEARRRITSLIHQIETVG